MNNKVFLILLSVLFFSGCATRTFVPNNSVKEKSIKKIFDMYVVGMNSQELKLMNERGDEFKFYDKSFIAEKQKDRNSTCIDVEKKKIATADKYTWFSILTLSIYPFQSTTEINIKIRRCDESSSISPNKPILTITQYGLFAPVVPWFIADGSDTQLFAIRNVIVSEVLRLK